MKKIIAILSVFLMLVSCSTSNISYDYDRSANFSQYKSYKFHPNMNLSTITEIEGQRLLTAIEQQMQAKGFVKSETPDIYVDVAPVSRTRKENSGSIGLGMGNWGGNFGIDIGTAIPLTRKVQDSSLTLEFYEVKNMHLVWQGVFEDTSKVLTDAAQKDAMVQKAISDVLTQYPPKN